MGILDEFGKRNSQSNSGDQFKFDPNLIHQNVYRYIKKHALPSVRTAEEMLYYLQAAIEEGFFPEYKAGATEEFIEDSEDTLNMLDAIKDYLAETAAEAFTRLDEDAPLDDNLKQFFDEVKAEYPKNDQNWREYLAKVGDPFAKLDSTEDPDEKYQDIGEPPSPSEMKKYRDPKKLPPAPFQDTGTFWKWKHGEPTEAMRNPFHTAQELKNDVMSSETEQPSAQSVDDPTNSLEFVDRTDQKKNRVPGPHGDSLNKAAQHKFSVGDDAWYLDDGMHCTIEKLMDTPDRYYVECDDGHIDWVYGNELSGSNPNVDVVGDETVIASVNPFHVAQKETGQVNESMSDNETAETGAIGGNFDKSESYNGGGRTPGKLDNPTPNHAVTHENSINSKREQITT